MKKWNEEDVILFKNLFEQKINKKIIAQKLGRTLKSVQLYGNRTLGLHFKDNLDETIETVDCVSCNSKFKAPKVDNRKFCNKSCSAKYNSSLKKKIKQCLNCESIILKKSNIYCNSVCEEKHKWSKKSESAFSGKISHQSVRGYMIHLHGAKCMECGWDKVNPYTNKVPIELEHIDGNSENNKLENLKLICPNCHALTATYKGANAGNGRAYRRQRYAEGKSY